MNKQEAARANKAKDAAVTKMAGEHVPRKGKRAHGGGPEKGTPKKGRTEQVLQMVQGCWQTVHDPQHHGVS